MSKVKTILCLSASSEFYGKWIRRITRSPVNHAFVMFQHPELSGDRWWAIQVAERGVVLEPAERVVGSPKMTLLECYACTGTDLWPGVQVHFGTLGAGYDWWGIFGFLLMIEAKRLFGIKIPNLYHGSGQYFCSEFVMTVLRGAGLNWAKCLIPSEVSPANLREMILCRIDRGWSAVPCPVNAESAVLNNPTNSAV